MGERRWGDERWDMSDGRWKRESDGRERVGRWDIGLGSENRAFEMRNG